MTSPAPAPATYPLGDSALTVTFGPEAGRIPLQRILASAETLRAARLDGVDDVVAGSTTVTVFYDAMRSTYAELSAQVVAALGRGVPPREPTPPRAHVVGVRYDGPDLAKVARACGLRAQEVIQIHGALTYIVELIGFVPGFAYLGELDARLRLPRRSEPRPRVPAGSVAIAGARTAVYPLETPGGWHLLGHTDAAIFDPARAEPSLFRAGDSVRFEAIG